MLIEFIKVETRITFNRIIGRICRPIRKFWAQNYYKSLKNLHKGKRGFVIGNGPSLRIEDLNKLNNEITIASNKIYLAFEETKWRPNYYTVADPILWPKIKNELKNIDIHIFHIPSNLDDIPISIYKKTRAWNNVKRAETRPFSDDFSEKVYGGGSITYQNIQFAYYLGLNPIYIIGCDHNYNENTKSNESVLINHVGSSNHFHKKYRVSGERVLSANIDLMNEYFYISKTFLKDKSYSIYNSTRGGNLNIFQRREFESLFNKNQ